MKAFTLDRRESQPALRGDLPEPSPAANEIVVRVHASSANPVDAFIGMGALAEMFEHEFPVILGATSPGSSNRSATASASTALATRCSGSSRTPIRPCTPEVGPS